MKIHNINEIKSYNSGNILPENKNDLNEEPSTINQNMTPQKVTQISSKTLKIKDLNGTSKENINSNIDTTSSNNQNINLGNNFSNNNIINKKNEKINEVIHEKIKVNKNNNQRGNLSQRTIDHTRLINPLIPPADPLLKRTILPVVNPKFGKMKTHIILPEFIGKEPITKFEYKPTIINLQNQNEKMYEVNLYINSHIMLNKLVYLKTSLNKDGCIDLENIVNVKKLNVNSSIDYNDNVNQGNNNFNNNIIENKPPTSYSVNQNENQSCSQNLINSNSCNNFNYLNKNPNEPSPYYTLKSPNDSTLIFESRFESGNLLCAFRGDNDNSYQLYLQNDTNTTGYIQWFFFRVSNTKKGKRINFNIINMLRKTCLYQSGMKIMVYSTKQAEKENIGWHRDCINVMYYPNNLYVFNKTTERKRLLYSLTFDYEFKYDNDIVYFANSIPYFYSTLMKELNKYELDEEKYPFFHRKTLCSTLGGNDLDMFTINSYYDIYKSIGPSYHDKRKGIVLIARQHPGETVGSYVMQGCIDFLMGNSDEAKKLRDIYIIKIVPMMNPDGVLVGNSRTSFAGCDLNRRWLKPNEIIHPEIYYTKEMILKLALQREIAFICDFHGHFGAFNSFFYCNYKDNRRLCSLFPFICCKLSKIISYQQCNYGMPKFKYSTGRVTLFNELNKENEIDGGKSNNSIVALETSFFGVNRAGELSRTYFTSDLIKQIGRDVCLGMLAYYYKYENVKIDKQFFNIDIDMKDFDDEIIKEEKEDFNEDKEVDEKSESEPSIDNFEKDKIMKLLPTKAKRRKKGKKHSLIKKLLNSNSKRNVYNGNNILNNSNIEIKLFNPLTQNLKPQTGDKNDKKPQKKIIINCNNTKKVEKEQKEKIEKEKTPNFITEPPRKDAQTQTEDIFFKMHWSYFAGEYPILQSKLGNRMMISVAKKKFEGMYRSKSQSDNLGIKLNFNLNMNNPGAGNVFKAFKGNNLNMNNTSNQFNSSSFKKLNPLQKSQYINKNKPQLKKNIPYFVKGNYNNNINGNNTLFGNTNMKLNQGLGNLK